MTWFNHELFKTLILNFAHIHSKRRKLGMFIFYVKSKFNNPNKVNKPRIRQFPSFSIFGHVTSHYNQALRCKKTSRFTFGENFILFLVS